MMRLPVESLTSHGNFGMVPKAPSRAKFVWEIKTLKDNEGNRFIIPGV